MPRIPNEMISQRELIYRYRTLLDEAMRMPPDKRRTAKAMGAKARIVELAKNNPRSTSSKNVMWNIGKSRREWLLAFLEKEYPGWCTDVREE
jgi:hypothetical protein